MEMVEELIFFFFALFLLSLMEMVEELIFFFLHYFSYFWTPLILLLLLRNFMEISWKFHGNFMEMKI